jgi:hypothetical protein
MISQNYIYLSLLFAVIGYGGYIRDTWRGETKPNRVSWSLWALAALVTLASQQKLNGGIQLLYTAMQVILPLTIFLVSFKDKKGYWKLTSFDYICGAISLVGIGLLLFTHHPLAALWLGIFTDFFASIPTIKKCYTDPDSESWKTYFFAIISSLTAVLTVKPWAFVNYSFAFYVMLINVVFTVLILMPRKKSKKRS